ncbi:serine/threonine-protein kinase [Nocardia sp. NPDC024068]|uniref:serine/threonine-protein kinase n=1 Tax=Nocardia sp. NPDC024068 TaxID=3157197 RepID=UPI0033CBC67B
MTGGRLGRYRLDRLLGQGGMGQVWLATADPAGGRPARRVALKLLPAELAADPTYRSRFEREAELAARLHDSHIVPIHAHGELDGRLFIEMDFVEGDDLSRILRRDGALSPARAVDIVSQIATALDAAHRAGLVHRDVKPSNIVVRGDGFAYLIDFGIAHGAGSTALTASGLAVGTWAYMAPERFTGHTDARADVYSLGCVLFESLAGARPFGDTDPARQMHDHLTAAPPSVRAVVPGIPAELDRVIARALAKDPGHRYPGAGEFARAAADALAGRAPAGTVPAEHPGTRAYDVGTAPAATRRYEAPAPDLPATRRYEAAALPGTLAYTEYAPPAHPPEPAYPATRAYTRFEPGYGGAGAPVAPYDPRAGTHGGPTPPVGPVPGPRRPTPAVPGRRPPRGRTQAPPRRRRRRFPRLLLWPLVLIVVPLVLIGGCVAALVDGAGSFQIFTGGSDSAPGPAPGPGDPIRDGNFEFVVRNVESGVQAVGLERAEGTFVVVSFTVRNIAADPKTYMPLGQELHDTAGGTFAPDVTATAVRSAAAAAPRSLQPGESLGTHLVYGVPAGSVPASMTFRDFPLSRGTSVPLG